MKFFNTEQIDNIRRGYYSAVYFNRTQNILLTEKNLTPVTMQIFQKQHATLAGIAPIVEIFKQCTGYFENSTWINMSNLLRMESLKDGEKIAPWETVVHITGPYAYFAHLESVYLGILARSTKVATNVHNVVTLAGKKQVIFFADRFDLFVNQEIDGYAANIGGAAGVATAAQAVFFNQKPMGTIPHALIAVHNGNTLQAAESFVKQYPDVPLIVLVDFENDCVKTSLEVARHFGKKLYGVRLDTSEMLVDKSLQDESSAGVTRVGDPHSRGPLVGGYGGDERQDPKRNGVNPQLVKNVRQALDKEGFQHVKITVSGGFDAEKIKLFENQKTPVDIYGVGSSLLKGNIDFTADVVKVGKKEIAKFGRKYLSSKKLQAIDRK